MSHTRPPRVVHLTSVHAADDTRILHKECRSLADAGYDVTMIAQAPLVSVERAGVRVVVLRRPASRWRRVTETTWAVLRAAWREDAALYHLHDPELLPVGLILKLRGARVVYDVHEDWPAAVDARDWIPVPARAVARRGVAALELCAARLLDAVVAVTPEIAARFPPDKVALVQNFPLGDERTVERAPADHQPIVAYIGDLTEIRGARTMVEAMGRLPIGVAARLVIAGTFSPLVDPAAGAGCSEPPPAPADLQLVAKDNGEVSLSWSGGGARRTFTLEAGTTPGAADARVVELGAEMSYRVTQVKAGTYYVRVRATNACGTGPASNELVVVVP